MASTAETFGVSDLSDFVDSLKRAVATPGEFTTVYGNTTDDDLTGALMDGFAEAQLDGFFTPSYGGVSYSLDLNASLITPDLSNAQVALVVIYAAHRMIYTRLVNLKTRQKYAAKGADYETEQAASVLTELLKEFKQRKDDLVEKATYSGSAAAFHMADGYFLAATQQYYVNGYDYGAGGYGYSNADPGGF